MSETCEQIRRELLDRDWDAATLRAAATISGHVDRCAECRAALGEYDELRSLLKCPEPVPEAEIAGTVLAEHGGSGIRENSDDVRLAACRNSGELRYKRWAWVAALAASLMIAAVGWVLYFQARTSSGGQIVETEPRHKPVMPTTPEPRLDDSIRLTESDIQQGVAVFDAVSETFEGRTSWVAIAGESADLGLMPAPVSGQRKVVLLRLAMSRGDSVLSNTDLVIVPGQAADLTVPLEQGRELHYHVVTPGDDSRQFSLWVEVRPTDGLGEAIATLATALQPDPDTVQDAGRLVTNTGKYELAMSFSEAGRPEVTP